MYPRKICLPSLSYSVWMQVFLCLLAAASVNAQKYGGDFRYSMLRWEVGSKPFEAIITLQTSWSSRNLKYTPTGSEFLLLGYRSPTLTITSPDFNPYSHSDLVASVRNFSNSSSIESAYGGGWVMGETQVTQQFTSKGPHNISFSGCCWFGTTNDFYQEIYIDFSVDYSANLIGLQQVNVGPGSSFFIPALRPHPNEPEMYTYGWSFCSDSLGLNLDHATGLVTVPASVSPGLNYLCINNAVEGAMSSSSSLFLLSYSSLEPTLNVQDIYPLPQAKMSNSLWHYTFYTGFPIHVNLSVRLDNGRFTGFLQDWSNPSPFHLDFDGEHLNISWIKPCLGQHNEFTHCYSFYQGESVSRPFCVHIILDEDAAPVFKTPLPWTEFNWFMGKEASFQVLVEDNAPLDYISVLQVYPGTLWPPGLVISHADVNKANNASITLSLLPPPIAGGGRYLICFNASDTAGSRYTNCRRGTRDSTLCVYINVARCRYVVRPRETLEDIARLFWTDWVQLWAVNPDISHPDTAVGYDLNSDAFGATINIGHLYQVSVGDTVASVAFKFGTTIKNLLQTNADLIDQVDLVTLQEGSTLCVIPNSCRR